MNRLFVKSEGQWLPLVFEEICWVTKSRSKKNYVTVCSHDRVFESKLSLTAMEAFLPDKEFIRVHNSFIIRVDKISQVGSGFAHVKLGEKRIPVGDSFVVELKKHCNFVS